MIVPLGHDTGKLRRRPLVSWALLGLCTAVFLATTGLSDPVGDAADAQLDAAFSYWREHPDLEPPELLVRAHGDPGHDARGAFARQLDQAGARWISRGSFSACAVAVAR